MSGSAAQMELVVDMVEQTDHVRYDDTLDIRGCRYIRIYKQQLDSIYREYTQNPGVVTPLKFLQSLFLC